MKQEYLLSSLEDTRELAADLANSLKGGIVVALYGQLGAGKTTLVQGIAQRLGIEKRVMSPTFVMMRQYKIEGSGLTLYHVDLYRCENREDVRGLGLEELMGDKNGVVIIEWPELVEDFLPKNTWRLRFEVIDETTRRVKMSRENNGKGWEDR